MLRFSQSTLSHSYSIQESFKQKREEYMHVLQKKEESIRQAFVQKVKEKENELAVAEQEVRIYVM